MNKEELYSEILKHKVISFDIFDTLITRIVDNPEIVFKMLGVIFNIDNFDNIRKNMQSECGLKLIDEKNYPHANIDEIYDYIKEKKGIKNTKDIMDKELSLEKELLFQNPEIYEVYKYARKNNKRVVVTSDMYILLDDIKDILKKCGYDKFDEIYLSSDRRKAKFNGELFDLLIEEENVLPNEILHIGDNYNHDYLLAKSKGIDSYHYTSTLLDKHDDIALSLHYGINRLIKLRKNDFWTTLGSTGGLLYYAIYKKLLEKNENNYIFLARDGYNMYKLFNKYTKKHIEYLYASRRSMLLASIDEINEDSLRVLPPFTLGQTVKEILSFICMDDIYSLNDIKSVGFTSFDDVIKNVEDIDKFKKLYLIKEKEFLNVCSTEREAAYKYFKKVGLIDKDNYVFDCGWNGSSQYLLNNLLNKISSKSTTKFFYTGIFDNSKSRRQISPDSFETYLFGFDDNQELANSIKDSIVILELFFGAPHNSVYKYSKDTYVLDDFENDFEYKEKILNGIMDYFELMIPIMDKYNFNITRDNAIYPIVNLINNPTNIEAVTIGNISNVDSFASKKGEEKYIAKVTMEQLNNNPNTEIYWKKGLLTRDDIPKEVKDFVKKKYHISEVSNKNSKPNIFSNSLERVKSSIRQNGYKRTIGIIKNKVVNKIKPKNEYKRWIKKNEKDILKTDSLSYNPFISIVVPVYNADPRELDECILSVKNQTYTNWELCLVDDHSTKDETLDTLHKYEGTDDRIKIKYNKVNGHISKTSNDGIDIASGEFIALLDNDDTLAVNALYEMVKMLNLNKKLDFIYSDEDKLSPDGKIRHDPFFKPDWSPNTFMSLMYTCHFAMFRKSILKDIGGFTVGLDGAQDYDLVLRFTEKTNNIAHISKILYHWRERDGSIASNPEAKPYALKAIVSLKEEALKRRKLKGKVVYDPRVFQYRVVYDAPKKDLTLIVKSNDINKTNKLLDKIYSIDKEYIKEVIILSDKDININTKYKYNIVSNDYSKYKNLIKTNYVFFIEDDIIINSNSIISVLLGAATLKDLGCTSPKILYKNTNVIYSDGISKNKSNILNGYNDSIPVYYCRNCLDYDTYSVSDKVYVTSKDNYDYIINNDIGALNNINKYNVIRNDVIVYIDKECVLKKESTINDNDPFINSNLNTNFEIKK